MKLIRTLLLMIFSTLALAACADSPDDLVGTYAVEERGQLKEFIRVEKHDGKFTISDKQGGDWRKPKEIAPLSKEELEKLLKEPVTDSIVALGSKGAVIVKVPKGWKHGRFESKTGVWLATMFGPIELHRK